MIKVTATTPFGAVLEREPDGGYQSALPCRVYLNGAFHCETAKNIISLFGLLPGTRYRVELRGLPEPVTGEFQTEAAGFVLDVRHYNAQGDGSCNDTAAIAAAIYTAPDGAVVVFPPGRYLVDHILLKSGVDLYLQRGAVICHNPDRDSLAIVKGYQKNYDHTGVTIGASWEGHPLDCFCSLVYGKDIQNVRIYGHGVLDGGGGAGGWWEHPKEKNRAFRPRNLFLNHCADILVAGIESRNSAAWNIHPFYSDNLRFYDLAVHSAPTSPNTDGLNPESCAHVEIAGCHFRVGDDCIAIKAGKFFMSRRHLKPCRNITIRSCLMEQGHGGVVIGSELSCGVRDVVVRRCVFRGTDRGLRIKTRRGRGDTAAVAGVHFHHNEMEGVRHCIVVNMFYNCDPDGHSEYVQCKTPLSVDEGTPAVRDIWVRNLIARRTTGCGVFLYGLPESPIHGVRIENSRFDLLPDRPAECPAMMDDPVSLPDAGIIARHVRGLRLTDNCWTGPHTDRVDETEDADG